MNDRIKELIVTKDTDSIADYSLLDQTVCNEWQQNEEDNSTIGKNWIKIDKSKLKLNDNLNQQLANLDYPCIEELEKNKRIIEINGRLSSSLNNENLVKKLKQSTSPIQMIILD